MCVLPTRSRLCLLACMALLFAGGTYLGAPTPPRPTRIQVLRYASLRGGMTEKEVEGLLGGPAGDYSSPQLVLDYSGAMNCESDLWSNESYLGGDSSAPAAPGVSSNFSRVWAADEGKVTVDFNPNGRVVSYLFNATNFNASPSE